MPITKTYKCDKCSTSDDADDAADDWEVYAVTVTNVGTETASREHIICLCRHCAVDNYPDKLATDLLTAYRR